MPTRWPGPVYEVRATFDAPLEFVYRWCTDYTPRDARLEEESYERRLLRRSRTEVVYEDLEELNRGWYWTRTWSDSIPPIDGIPIRWEATARFRSTIGSRGCRGIAPS